MQQTPYLSPKNLKTGHMHDYSMVIHMLSHLAYYGSFSTPRTLRASQLSRNTPLFLFFSERVPVGNLASTYSHPASSIVCVYDLVLLSQNRCITHHRGGSEYRTVSPVCAHVIHALMFTDHTTSKTSCLLVPGLSSTYTFLSPFPPPPSITPTSPLPFPSH